MNFLPPPASLTAVDVRKALQSLAVASEGKSRRTVAVLGTLAAEPAELMDLGRFLVRLDLTVLLVVGAGSARVHAGAVLEGSWGEESRHVDTVERALTVLRAEVQDDDVLLVLGLPELLSALEGAA